MAAAGSRVGVLLHQEELKLRRHHRAQAQLGVGRQHAAQYVAWRQLVRLTALGVAIVDDLRGGVGAHGTMRTVSGSGRSIMSESDGEVSS